MRPKLQSRMTVKNNVGLLRRNLNISQDSLAKRCGITQRNLSLIEAGKVQPSYLTAWLICKALKENDITKVFQINMDQKTNDLWQSLFNM